MKKKCLYLALAACLCIPAGANAASIVHVTTGADRGKGSLRVALLRSASKIVIDESVAEIVLDRPLVYRKFRPLVIEGFGQVISTSYRFNDSKPLLKVSRGADLTLSNLTFQAPGGYSIENQGGGKGIFVEIPKRRSGTVSVRMSDVEIRDTGNHGLHVSDCSLGDDCGGGQGGGGEGSAASIFVDLNRVTVDGAGFGKQDADGVRVDDRGDGDIIFNATDSVFVGVGADGVELDEGNNGSVVVNVRNSTFESNGAYCKIDGDVAELASLDPNCVDGGEADLDDAFDIDEAGPGGITGVVSDVLINGNLDEGLDFDAEGDGVVDLDFIAISNSVENGDEDIKVSEAGAASVIVKLAAIDVVGDIEFEEEGVGDLEVTFYSASVGDDLKLLETEDGEGTLTLINSTVVDDIDIDGDSDPITQMVLP